MSAVEKCLKRARCVAAHVRCRDWRNSGTSAWFCLSYIGNNSYNANVGSIYALYRYMTNGEKAAFERLCPFPIQDGEIKYPLRS